jgi:hypothetical protein
MNAKIKALLTLIGLGIVDAVLPVPILAIILIMVVLHRPAWFTDMVRDIYNSP